MRCYGICERAGVGALGIEIPLEPRTLTPVQTTARINRQAARLAGGPAATATPSLAGPMPTPAPAPAAKSVLCEGGCGVPVTAEYIVRTGNRHHGCCHPADPAGLAGTAGPAAAAGGALAAAPRTRGEAA